MKKYCELLPFVLLASLAIPESASASRCYAQVGELCVQKSYGNLDSTCSNPCSIGITERVQRSLKVKGISPGPIDGRMGPKLKKALRTFQEKQNLPVTGLIDKQTLDALGLKE